jgi:hypothetical protein
MSTIKAKPLGYRFLKEIAHTLWGLNEETAEKMINELNPYSISYTDNWSAFKAAAKREGVKLEQVEKGDGFYNIYLEKDSDKIRHTFYLDVSTLEGRLSVLQSRLMVASTEEKLSIIREIGIEEKRLGLLQDTLRNMEY